MYIFRLIILTLLVFVIQIVLFKYFGYKKVYYKRYFEKSSVFEGEKVVMIEEIHNNKILPVPWFKIESQIDGSLVFGDSENLHIRHKGLHESVFSLLPFTRIVRKHTVLCTKRGDYFLGNVYITFGSLVGGAANIFETDTGCRLTVYPKIIPIKELPVMHHSIFGDILMKRWIMRDPFQIAGTNEYTFNEPMNLINWKATARSNNLRVHNLDFSSDLKIMVLMNVDLAQDQWLVPLESEIVEQLILISASFVYKALRSGIETGFGTNASCNFDDEIEVVRPGTGNEHLYEILRNMAKIRLKRHLTFYTYLRKEAESSKANYDYLIISWYDSNEIQNYIQMLINKGNSVRILTGKDLRIAREIN